MAKNELRTTVDREFPNLMDQIKKVDINDSRLNAALFRDFSHLSAGYLLESSHLSYMKTKSYGLGSEHLPENIAVPLKVMADRVKYGQPLLEYAYGYGLYNWKFAVDPTPGSTEYTNEMVLPKKEVSIKKHLNMIRKLNGCTDEAGFMLVHVAIGSKTNQ